jgi:hypothetical protein
MNPSPAIPAALATVLALISPSNAPADEPVAAADAVPGAWSVEQVDAVLDKADVIRLAPSLDGLGAGERRAVAVLLEAGQIFERIYEDSRHPQALQAEADLRALDERLGHPPRTARLLDLYRLFQGPIATTLDNQRQPFLDVEAVTLARNVYPLDASKDELSAFLDAHPEARETILGERTVVRRATAENLARDRATLARHPVAATLHGELAAALDDPPDGRRFYAVPYAVAYADDLLRAHRLLNDAAAAVAGDDPELARYLRNRGRDLLSNDYESGDASWVTGQFRHLEVEIGAYETYDDALFGVKAFHALSLLLNDVAATEKLRRDLGGLQAIEDALPYDAHKRVREDIPVGVYDVIADFGQARGTNTATILPNDALFSRRYGRKILLRRNVMSHPDLFASRSDSWRAVVVAEQADDLVPEGDLQRTLWHEIGHYLGVDRTADGRSLDAALGGSADALEEMKADLVSLTAHARLHAEGKVDDATWRAVQASGIRRTLQNNQPRRDQPYQTMQLAQFNWFLDHGLLDVDAERRLRVDYQRYAEVVAGLLAEVLRLQRAGDAAEAERFFDRWTAWSELHKDLAARIRDAQGPRFHQMRYAALGE